MPIEIPAADGNGLCRWCGVELTPDMKTIEVPTRKGLARTTVHLDPDEVVSECEEYAREDIEANF